MSNTLTEYILHFKGLPVRIRRKRIRHGHVRVYGNGEVSLSVPLALPPARLEEILEARWQWIEKQRALCRPPQTLSNGATLPFLGRNLSLCLMERPGRATVAAHGDILFMHIRPGLDEAGKGKALAAWYKRRLEEVLGPLLSRWQQKMGVCAQSWAIRAMKSRWGSCRPLAAALCFSLELCKKPLECIEFVVVHELAHLRERGHGPRFQAILDAAMPDWKQRRKLLNDR